MPKVRECAELKIKDIRLWVSLGCSAQEKYHPQMVSVDIDLIFKVIPEGMRTDKLSDTICYAALVEKIQAAVQQRQFNLIEYLTAEIYKLVLEVIHDKKSFISSVNIRVNKLSPPVPGIYGGVNFIYRQHDL